MTEFLATIDPVIVLATGMAIGALMVLIAAGTAMAIEDIRFRRALNKATRDALHDFRLGQPETSASSN